MEQHKRTLVTGSELKEQFPWLTDNLIKNYLPKAQYYVNCNNKKVPAWNRKEAVKICQSNENILAARKKYNQLKQQNINLRLEYQAFVSRFTPRELILQARELDRHFILHIGPTNSGKTYTSLETFKGSASGVYLGPLRLMALEVFDKLNGYGIPCSLLTGEERISIPCSRFTASTVEMADFQQQYEVAVIDEAQMISDPIRGAHWFDAICKINAKTVHICLAPEAENLITDIIDSFGSPYEVVHHERLAPLFVGKQLSDVSDIIPGDAVIAFSREKVLKIAAELKKRGLCPAIIYGGLPPKSRRIEVEDYISGNKNVIVATDAIGMGLSLPIRRIVFAELRKYDGFGRRMLFPSELQQIAGRAGRFGVFEYGEVTGFRNVGYISHALQREIPEIKGIRISFPGDEAVASEYPLQELIAEWQRLPREGYYYRENMNRAMQLLKIFPGKLRKTNKETVYKLITCPFDPERRYMTDYWEKCVRAILDGRLLPVPNFGLKTLESCEQEYKALDLYNILCVKFGQKNYCENFQDEIIRRISFLLQNTGSPELIDPE